MADVVDLLAHLVPQVRNRLGADRVLQIDEHDRLAGLGVAPHEVEVGQLLQLLLDTVGDLAQRVVRGRARPQRLDDHGLDGEGRILLAAELAIGPQAGERRDEHQVDDKALIAQGPV